MDELSLDHNDINDEQMSIIQYLINLKKLEVNHTKITRLTHFATLTKITVLWVSGCLISDPDELLVITKMDKLRELYCHELWCYDNKMCED